MTTSVSSFFDQNYYQEKITDDKGNIVELTVYTSDPLILTQDIRSNIGRVLYVPPTSDLNVYGDVIRIRGPISLPGRRVQIVARVLEEEADSNSQPAALSVDGSNGTNGLALPKPTANIGNPGTPGNQHHNGGNAYKGDDGVRGDDGKPGRDGGTIQIYSGTISLKNNLTISSNGGTGGNGVNGQNGGDGGKGGNGVSGTANEDSTTRGTNGGNGGNGGAGGAGGDAGAGGTGGRIEIYTLDDSYQKLTTDVVTVKGGIPGSPGQGGHGGLGGAKGTGGAETSVLVGYDIGSRTVYKQVKVPGGSDGSYGMNGPNGSTGRTYQVGKSGQSYVQKCELRDLAPRYRSDNPLRMMLSRAKALYLSAGDNPNASQISEASAILQWIKQIGFISPNSPLYKQANILLIYMSHGKNVFGHDLNFVPSGSQEYWLKQVDDSLKDFEDLESTYFDYAKENQTTDEQLKTLKYALQLSDSKQSRLTSQLSDLTDQLASTAALIDQTSVQVQNAKMDLEQSLAYLQQAIEDASGLKIEDFLDALQTLAFMPGSTLTQASMFISQAGKLIDDDINTIVDDKNQHISREYLVEKVGVFGTDFSNLQEGYSFAGAYLKQDDPNAAKLLYDQSKLDSMLDGIMSWSEAQDARSKMQDYVNVVNSCNNSVLTYNSYVSQYVNTQNQLQDEIAQQKLIQSQLSDGSNPNLPEMTQYMASAYEQVRDDCLYNLYMSIRAAAFWSLDSTITMQDIFQVQDIAQINSAVVTNNRHRLEQKMSAAHEKLTQDAQPFQDIEYVIDDKTHPDLLSQWKSGKLDNAAISFDLVTPHTHANQSIFSGMSDVRVDTIRVWLDGVQTADGKCQIELRHNGVEMLSAPSGDVFRAVHTPKNILFRYNLKDQSIVIDGKLNDTANTSSYATVGPFTTWQMSMTDRDNQSLDLSNLTQIRIVFQGTSRGFNQNVLAAVNTETKNTNKEVLL